MSDQSPNADIQSTNVELQSTNVPQPYIEPSITSEIPQKTECLPFIEPFSQTTPKPYTEATQSKTIAPIAISDDLDPMMDAQLFPKSSQIYQALCEKFGATNVSQLPQFMRDKNDQERTKWYKTSHKTNLLYFLHKSDKYKATMQQILNLGCCANCCCYTSLMSKGPNNGIYKSSSGPAFCLVCIEESSAFTSLIFIPCYPLYNASLPYFYEQFYGEFNPAPSDSSTPSPCCSFHERSLLRIELFSALKKSGLQTSLPPCPCLISSFCNSCVAMQYEAIFGYYAWKRYRKQVPEFQGRIQAVFEYSHQPFLEWYDIDAVVQSQNLKLEHKLNIQDFITQHNATPAALTM